jgi:hypothetical protein
VFLRLRYLFAAALVGSAVAVAAFAQATPAPTPNVAKPTPTPAPTPNVAKPTATPGRAPSITVVMPTPTPTPTPKPPTPVKIDLKNLNAEQVAESTILFYGYPYGRALLDRIRKTTYERGTISALNGEGRMEQANYTRFIMRGESMGKEKIRLDQEFPTARFSLVFSDGKVFGIYNNTVFTPREDAVKKFESQIVHGLDALLRYKENGSQITLASREKIMGVDYYVIEVSDKQDRKTRFYISARSFRVMMLTYDEEGVKYKRKFYDYNYAQGTLVPYRSILWADDKQIEESEVGTVTFGQKVDENLFNAG